MRTLEEETSAELEKNKIQLSLKLPNNTSQKYTKNKRKIGTKCKWCFLLQSTLPEAAASAPLGRPWRVRSRFQFEEKQIKRRYTAERVGEEATN